MALIQSLLCDVIVTAAEEHVTARYLMLNAELLCDATHYVIFCFPSPPGTFFVYR